MGAMSEIHAEVHLATSAPAADAIRTALNEVSIRALAAEGCDDLATARKALREVTWAAIRAAEIINTIERETREAALARVERAA
jgi:hypothetical protein